MRKHLIACFALLSMASCQPAKDMRVIVSNPLDFDRKGEMVEFPVKEVMKRLRLQKTDSFVVYDSHQKEVPHQVTSDKTLIFPVEVAANALSEYIIKAGTPAKVAPVATGLFVPQRKDDIAWENDLVAYRAYGPALQRSGEKAYGFDVWTKNNTTQPVVAQRYYMELNVGTVGRIDSFLRAGDKAGAEKVRQETSYHVDHGNGMDCYSVGATLGAGATALLTTDGQIVYPYCFISGYILDNGPLRFKIKLVYKPFTIGADTAVVETRIISLDAGSHMNKTIVSYDGLSKPTPLAVGIVLHEEEGVAKYTINAKEGYITYTDPTDQPSGINGQIFVGAILPAPADNADAFFFEPDEADERKAAGHLLGINEYEPDSDYLYYWGSAWSKADIKTTEEWNQYIVRYAQQVRHPLVVTRK